MTETTRRPRKKAVPPPPPEPAQKSRMASGFANLREILSYVLGAGVLVYGVTEAPTDKAYIVVGAGLALLGAPMVGTIFDKKTKE